MDEELGGGSGRRKWEELREVGRSWEEELGGVERMRSWEEELGGDERSWKELGGGIGRR